MIIGVDFDCTLFDSNTPWLDAYYQATGYKAYYANILNWNFEPAIPAEYNGFFHTLRTPDIYYNCLPINGAVLGTEQLSKHHTLICITSDSRRFVSVKQELMRRFFPHIQHIVFASNKWAVIPSLDVLIDDALHNNPTHTIPQPWNSPSCDMPWSVHHTLFWEDMVSIYD